MPLFSLFSPPPPHLWIYTLQFCHCFSFTFLFFSYIYIYIPFFFSLPLSYFFYFHTTFFFFFFCFLHFFLVIFLLYSPLFLDIGFLLPIYFSDRGRRQHRTAPLLLAWCVCLLPCTTSGAKTVYTIESDGSCTLYRLLLLAHVFFLCCYCALTRL